MMESHLFSDLDLARRLEGAEAHSNAKFVEARARVFPQSGARWIQVAGAYAMYDGVSSPVTQTFGLGLFQPVTSAALDEIEEFFTERGAPVFHEISPLADASLTALLNERNYHPVEFTSVLYRSIRRGMDLGFSPAERIRVRPIGEGEHDLWARTSAKGWGQSAELSDFMSDLGRVIAQREDGVSFLAEFDGEPIAAGALCLSAGVAHLAGASTIPEGRRRGAQLALLDARLRYAAEQGCEIALMGALPGSSSQRNAERHGFRIAYTRIKWGLAQQLK